MQCERLIKMIKSWYIHVQDETMAPARMVSFMKKHAKSCEVCLQDADLKEEIAKITEIVLPESKIPKAIRQKNEQTAQKEAEIEDESSEVDDDEETKVDKNGDETIAEDGDNVDDDEEDDKEDDDDLALVDDPDLLAPDV
jgi:hypothetical protein